jgi:hypothetical protein
MDIKYINGGQFESGDVKKINIYGNGEILFTLEQSYLEEYSEKGDTYGSIYYGAVITLYLENEIKRALKKNLNRSDNFYVKFVGDYSWESGKEIFIHESEIQVIDDGEKLSMKTEHEKNYLHAFTLLNKNGFFMNRTCNEKIVTGDVKWTLPENGRWSSCYGTIENPCYDTFENKITGEKGVIKRWIEPETITELKTAQRGYCRTEKDDYRKKCESLADKMNELNIFGSSTYVSHYDIERLLQHFDVIENGV